MHFKMLLCFLKNLFITFVQYIRFLFEYRDYHIKKAEIVYVRNEIKLADDITDEYKQFGCKKTVDELSKEVTDFLFRIKYFFNNREYIYLTRNPNHVFPPVKKAITFSLPVKEAILLDEDDKPVKKSSGGGT